MRKSSLLRLFVAALLLGGVWIAYTQQQRPPSVFKTNKIAADLYEIENVGSLAGNVTVLVTDEGLVVVDAKFDPDHDGIMAQIKTFTDKPIKYIVSTHHHGDHTGGNAKMQAIGAQIISSEETRENMVDGKMPGIPTLAFEHHTHIYLGGKNVELYHFGRAHTNGDSVVLFPAQRTIAMGDMFTYGDATPQLIDYAGGGSAKEWTRTLDSALRLDYDTVVPGHGAITKKSEVAKFRQTTIDVRNRVHEMDVQKKTKDEIGKMLQTDFHWGPLQMSRGLDGVIAEMQ
jgi:glyoxylase-like metal-dependent hydrolase (beta-lactamase superfamily II)